VLPVSAGKKVWVGEEKCFFYFLFLYHYMSRKITQQLIKKQTDTLNTIHKN